MKRLLNSLLIATTIALIATSCNSYSAGSEDAPYTPWWRNTEYEKQVEQF